MATNPSPLQVEPLGDQALLVVLGEGIDRAVNDRVHQLAALLRQEAPPGLLDLVPAYATLAVHYDPAAWADHPRGPHAALRAEIERLWRESGAALQLAVRQVEIPVCYGGDYGPDLGEMAFHQGLAEAEMAARHAADSYRVFMLGFTPGFAYLGGLAPGLAAPRWSTPRPRVPAGSVAIAGLQTGIYPQETPGGWQIIGRTPCRLFDPEREEPCLLRPGDQVRFTAITEAAFRAQVQGLP
jgi:KipI family sensor histidine kinase inhibitor